MSEHRSEAPRELDADARERVRRYALRLTGDPDRAEDVAQETALRVLQKDTPRDLPYLFRIALNLVRSDARRAWNRKRVTRDFDGMKDVRHGQPDQVAESREDSMQVWAAVGRLPERERIALVMRVGESMSCQDIAETLGTTPNAVSCLVRRGKDRLRRLLTEGGAS